MVNIPNFSKSKIIEVESDRGIEEITITEYRPTDSSLVAKIQVMQEKLPALILKVDALKGLREKIQTKALKEKKLNRNKEISEEEATQLLFDAASELNDSDFSEDDLLELEEMRKEIASIQGEVYELTSTLGQRGLKRFYYKNEPEYIQAEKDNRATDYIDSLDDIPFPVPKLNEIAIAMIQLGSPPESLQKKLERKADGKGK